MATKKKKTKKTIKKEPVVVQAPAIENKVENTTSEIVNNQTHLEDFIDNSTAPQEQVNPEQTTVEVNVRDAEPSPKDQVWLTLANGGDKFKDAICMAELFNNPEIEADKFSQAKGIWSVLARSGFYLHPSLEKQYKDQQFCFFCGGQVVKRTTDIGSDYHCVECNYLYSEE